MRRLLITTIALTVIFAGLRISFGQGPLTNALNLMLRTDSNGALYTYGLVAGAQGPLTNLANLQLRAYTGGALAVTVAGGTITPDTICLNATSQDACLARDAANTLALRNGTAAQRFNIYNTYTDSGNNEQGLLFWSSNIFSVGTNAQGSGTSRSLGLMTGGTNRWTVDLNGHLTTVADNSYDIGASGATRPRTGYFGTSLVAPTINATTTFQVNGTPGVGFALNQAEPADQTARSSSGGTFVMMGLGAAASPCTVTPSSSGRVVFIITGDLVNSTTATTVSIKMAESTGTAPANNAAATGTVISRTLVTNAVTSVLTTPFTLTATKTGLALATAVWFDLQLTTSGANTGQPTNIDCTAYEI